MGRHGHRGEKQIAKLGFSGGSESSWYSVFTNLEVKWPFIPPSTDVRFNEDGTLHLVEEQLQKVGPPYAVR